MNEEHEDKPEPDLVKVVMRDAAVAILVLAVVSVLVIVVAGLA